MKRQHPPQGTALSSSRRDRRLAAHADPTLASRAPILSRMSDPDARVFWRRRGVLGVIGVAFIVRVAWCVVAARTPVGLHDPSAYERLAQIMADGDGYTIPGGTDIPAGATAYYPVGYPAVLAGLRYLADAVGVTTSTAVLGAILQSILGTLTVAGLMELGRRWLAPSAAVAVGIAAGLYPSAVFHTAPLLSETMFIALCVAALIVLPDRWWTSTAERATIGRLAGFGVLTGFALLTRPVGLPLALTPAVAVLLAEPPNRWRQLVAPVLASAAIVCVACGVVLMPWAARNHAAFGSWTLSTNTGDNLCIGNNPDATGGFGLFPWCFAEVERVQAEGGIDRPAFESWRNDSLQDKATRWMSENPGRQPGLIWDRTKALMSNDTDGLDAAQSWGQDVFLSEGQRSVLGAIANIGYWMLLISAVPGTLLLWRRRAHTALSAVIAGWLMLAAPLITFGTPRFHVPTMVLVCIAVGASWAALAERARRYVRSP